MIGLALGIGCAGRNTAVRPDQMSADAHRQSAERERREIEIVAKLEAVRGPLVPWRTETRP